MAKGESQVQVAPETSRRHTGVDRQRWLGVFSDSTDQKRYKLAIVGAHIQFVEDPNELQEPGLLGVVFDDGKQGRMRDTLVCMVARGIPVVVGPRARFSRPLVWDMKSGVEAAGGIFEIATEESDFRQRINAVVRAAMTRWTNVDSWLNSYLQRGSVETPFPTSANLMLLDTLSTHLKSSPGLVAMLPGVRAATTDLRNAKSGRLDGELIRKCFNLNRAELAKLLNVSAEALRQTPDSPKHQTAFAVFERIAALRTMLADSSDFVKWLESPNAELENEKPIDLIREGRGEILDGLVQDLLMNRSA